jgi:hypothetical protein
MSIGTEIVAKYLNAQRDLVKSEDLDRASCLLSLPLHYSAYTRVEIAVTKLSEKQYLLTDEGQTLTELKNAGYAIGARTLERIREMIKIWRVDLVGITLTRTCRSEDIGKAVHEFGEATKTVGDAYLWRKDRTKDERAEESIKDLVRQTFVEHRYFYKESTSVPGYIEKDGHEVDFYIPANGSKGLALEVLTKPNKLTAEAWGFRARDMKEANTSLVVGFVYDETTADLNRAILNGMGDIALPTSDFILFTQQLEAHKVSRGHV